MSLLNVFKHFKHFVSALGVCSSQLELSLMVNTGAAIPAYTQDGSQPPFSMEL